jgi:hypothetical protein
MNWMKNLLSRLNDLLFRGHLERDLSEELRFHMQNENEKNAKAGMSPEEARYAALRGLGGVH